MGTGFCNGKLALMLSIIAAVFQQSIAQGMTFDPNTPATGESPNGLAVADVNDDYRLDLICENQNDSTLLVLTNGGNAGFGSNATLNVGNQPGAVITTDINEDGAPDLVSASSGFGTLTVLTNNGAGKFGWNATEVISGSGMQTLSESGGGSINRWQWTNTLRFLSTNASSPLKIAVLGDSISYPMTRQVVNRLMAVNGDNGLLGTAGSDEWYWEGGEYAAGSSNCFKVAVGNPAYPLWVNPYYSISNNGYAGMNASGVAPGAHPKGFPARVAGIWYIAVTNAGTFKLQTNIMGGGWNDVAGAAFDAATASTNPAIGFALITNSAVPTMSIRAVGTSMKPVSIIGAEAWNDQAGSTAYSIFSYDGLGISWFFDGAYIQTNLLGPALAHVNPNLLFLRLLDDGPGVTNEWISQYFPKMMQFCTNWIPNCDLVWCAAPPYVDSNPTNLDWTQVRQNNATRAMCEEYGLGYCDLFTIYGDPTNALALGYLSPENNVHPPAAGYQLEAGFLFNWLGLTTNSVCISPRSVVAADVNGDGNKDLVSASSGPYPDYPGTLTVFTNNGSGSFGINDSIAAPASPNAVLAADVNGDGKPDLITAGSGSHPDFIGTLMILTNNGSGIFGSNSVIVVGNQASPESFAVADVNGDGKPDLVSANAGAGTLTVFTNAGYGSFSPATTLNVGGIPKSVAAADLNGDGEPDLVSADFSNNTLAVFTNSGAGMFGYNTNLDAGSNPLFITAADVNADGKLDLISANHGQNTLTILANTSVYPPGTIPPALLRSVNGHSIHLQWASASPGWSLQQSPDLLENPWLPSGYGGDEILDDGTNKSLTLHTTKTREFFRLLHP